MTRNQLQAAAEKAGVKFEINPRYSEDSVYNHESRKFEKAQTGWYFGINNLSGRDTWSWTWFETIGMNDDEFWFVERYSMRTGKSNKGWRERISAHKRVAMLNGITLNELFDIK